MQTERLPYGSANPSVPTGMYVDFGFDGNWFYVEGFDGPTAGHGCKSRIHRVAAFNRFSRTLH